MVGALADILIHPRHRAAARLDHGEGLARVDRRELLPVTDQNELVDAQGCCDLVELEHFVRRHHRGFVDEKHGTGELLARSLISQRVTLGHEPLVGEHEGSDRLGLDARPFGEVRDHLVLEGKSGDPGALLLGDPRDRLEHGGLARAGGALHRDGTIGG